MGTTHQHGLHHHGPWTIAWATESGVALITFPGGLAYAQLPDFRTCILSTFWTLRPTSFYNHKGLRPTRRP